MARYKVSYPTGGAGKFERLPERFAAIGGVHNQDTGEYDFPAGPKAPTLEYLNAIASEYAGVMEVVKEGDDTTTDPSSI